MSIEIKAAECSATEDFESDCKDMENLENLENAENAEELVSAENSAEEESFFKKEYSSEKKERLTLLREQAMDISTRSHLLNGKSNTMSISFSSDAEQILMGNCSDEELLQQINLSKNEDADTKTVMLMDLYAGLREGLREKGENLLYLSVNDLEWKNEKGKVYEAALYLCPAEIYRNMRGELVLRVHTQKVFFNPVLRVFLDQICDLDSSVLLDNPNEKYREQMNLLQFMIEYQDGWKIIENTAHLAIFRVPNEAIRRGLYDERIISHEIADGIIKGEMNWKDELPDDTSEGESCGIYSFAADSFQQEIIESAFQRKAQLVVGPAGNGKTQTCVNIMLEAVRRGEHVLFVSEKASAMEVAKQKLEEVLGEKYIFSLLPGKLSPTDAASQLRSSLDAMEHREKQVNSHDFQDARKKYEDCLKYLEMYYDWMSRIQPCGKSLEQLIRMYEKYSASPFRLTLDEACAAIPLEEAEDEIGVLSGMLEEYDRIRGRYENYIRYDQSDDEKDQTLKDAQSTLRNYRRLQTSAENLNEGIDKKIKTDETGISIKSSLDENNEKEWLQKTIRIASLFVSCPVYHKSIEEIFTQRPAAEEFQTQLIEEIQKLTGKQSSFIKKRQRNKCEKLLQNLYSVKETKELLDEAEERPENIIEQLKALYIVSDQNGDIYIGKESEEKRTAAAFLNTVETELAEESAGVTGAVKSALDLIMQGRGEELLALARTVMEDYRRYSRLLKSASARIIKHPAEFAKDFPTLPKTVLIEEWIKNRNADTDRISLLCKKIKTDMENKGYGSLIRQLTEQKAGSVPEEEWLEDDIINGYYKAWAQYHIDRIEEKMISEGINVIEFKYKVRQLYREEERVRAALRHEIVQTQKNRIGNIEDGISNNPEFGMLQKLVRKSKTPIRSYFMEAPHMLMTLCPIMIMTPTAAAEYIPSDFPQFDLVLIDEGSQLPTCDALIPIAHAKRCMIFGDEKQLKPSESFRRKMKEEFDVDADRESILTAAYITGMPRKILRFHYRSEDESLIAFSNSHYYNNSLITVPSCDLEMQGITYEYVEAGTYDKEKAKVNAPEGKRVIERIREIYRELPDQTGLTIGVVTLNAHQRDYIKALLYKEMMYDGALAAKADRLVSVVNLENCQGKEWDVVILSPGFAADKNGKISAGFGALNREYGPNRLNVMLTRARRKMMVITSLDPYMLSGLSGQGVEDFRKFLLYAKGETTLDCKTRGSQSSTDDICRNVAAALEEAGYEVNMNIGASDFKVEIGVISEKDPNHYSIGILTDHYGSTDCIHDREIVCPQLLESKGWNIYRLRSLNWINNPQREVRKILRALESR